MDLKDQVINEITFFCTYDTEDYGKVVWCSEKVLKV